MQLATGATLQPRIQAAPGSDLLLSLTVPERSPETEAIM